MRYLHLFLRLYSSVVKAVGSITIPYNARPFVFKFIGKRLFYMTSRDFNIIRDPLNTYRNLNEFFTRKIDLKQRPTDNHSIISPCEGKVICADLIQKTGKLTQVKGITYSLDNLIMDKQISDIFRNGSFCNIYLSPRNYHRFNIPCSGIIEKIKHIPGTCYPVNSWGQQIKGLYTLNERVIVSIKNDKFNLCLVIVGATAVREITLFKKQNIKVVKGEELGMFQMGSSIVMLSDKKVFSTTNTIMGEREILGAIIKEENLF